MHERVDEIWIFNMTIMRVKSVVFFFTNVCKPTIQNIDVVVVEINSIKQILRK